MIHTRTKIIALLSFLFFVLCILGGFLFIQKVYQDRVLYTEKITERAVLIEREESLKALTETLTETEVEYQSLVTRILKEEDVIDFLALIESLGREQGVSLITRSLKTESVDTLFEELVMQYEIEGSYDAVVHTLALFEQLPYQSRLSGVVLSRESARWTTSFEFRVTKFKNI